jgi:hypothetical protein
MATRFFTIESAEVKLPEDYHGRFEAKAPLAAGSKAARQLFRFVDGKKKAIRFVLRETTQGSSGKEFHYVGMRTKLNPPRIIERGGKQITIQFEYSVKACK